MGAPYDLGFLFAKVQREENAEWKNGRCENCALGIPRPGKKIMCTKYYQISNETDTCKSYRERKCEIIQK